MTTCGPARSIAAAQAAAADLNTAHSAAPGADQAVPAGSKRSTDTNSRVGNSPKAVL